MLVTMKELLDRASKENYAVCAPNVGSELETRAAIEAAEEMKAPLILDVGFKASPDIVAFGKVLTDLCIGSSVPIAINLDHGGDFSHVIYAIRAGFTSVMVDRSTLPYDQNVAEVKDIVRIAHSVGVSVEAELGHVGQGTNYAVDRDAAMTKPEEAKKYIEDTGVDCLAVAIGTAHGAYIGTPVLDFDRLVAIKKATNNFPLVMHGGSGSGDENIRKACQLGINKVNINNDLMVGARDALAKADLTGNGAYGLFKVAKAGWKARLKELIDILGGTGKAWVPALKGTPGAEIVMEEA